ncbi:MAG: hypothetical protein AAFR79_01405 [Pseudomonadota bacterium]
MGRARRDIEMDGVEIDGISPDLKALIDETRALRARAYEAFDRNAQLLFDIEATRQQQSIVQQGEEGADA